MRRASGRSLADTFSNARTPHSFRAVVVVDLELQTLKQLGLFTWIGGHRRDQFDAADGYILGRKGLKRQLERRHGAVSRGEAGVTG